MAEQKSGPVKPPVLDLEANKGKAEKPGTSAGKTADKKAVPGFTGIARKIPLVPIAAGLGGALLGLTLVFGLATFGYWPKPQGSDAATLEIAALAQRLANIETAAQTSATDISGIASRLDAFETASAGAAKSLNETVAQLRQDIEALKSTFGNAVPVPDLAPLENQIAALKTRLDAMASGASSADAEAIAGRIVEINTRVAGLETAIRNMGEIEAQMRATIDELAAAADAEDGATQSGGALRLPLALSGFESAIASGKPFATELAALGADLPGLVIPPELAERAATGLPSPDSVAGDFTRAIPAMLAAKPLDPEATWQQKLADRAAAFLALRPAGDAEGKTPEATISRIEAALARHDLSAAGDNFAALPDPMRDASGETGRTIALLAAAERFAGAARALALAPKAGQSS